MSTRLTPEEWEEWDRRREASGKAEMGAWVRAVVAAAENLPPPQETRDGRPVVVVPEINRQAYRALVGAANNLNQIARRANLGRPLARSLDATLADLQEAARVVMGGTALT